MGRGGKGSYKARQKQQHMACVTLTLILVGIATVLAVLYFSIFRPKDPKISVPVMNLLSLYTQGFPSTTITAVNLTLGLQAQVQNPNKATFYIQQGCTASLYYHGEQIGFSADLSPEVAMVPAEDEVSMDAVLTVAGSSPIHGAFLPQEVASGILQVSASIAIVGKVTILSVFTHRSTVVTSCAVNVSLSTRGVESYSCVRSLAVDE